MPGKQHFAWLMALMLILTLDLVGCDIGRRQNAGLMGKWTAKCKDAADLLASIKDVPSAQLAEPKLKVALQELAEIDEQVQRLREAEEGEYIPEARLQHEMKQVAEGIAEMQRLAIETQRISKQPELKEALGDTWKELPSVAILEASSELPENP
jgi:hypothetical protein